MLRKTSITSLCSCPNQNLTSDSDSAQNLQPIWLFEHPLFIITSREKNLFQHSIHAQQRSKITKFDLMMQSSDCFQILTIAGPSIVMDGLFQPYFSREINFGIFHAHRKYSVNKHYNFITLQLSKSKFNIIFGFSAEFATNLVI